MERGEIIEAVKIVREQWGVDLRTAKDSVDRHRAGKSRHTLPSAAIAALDRGLPLEAIFIVRKACAVDLRPAKLLVDERIAGNRPLQQKLRNAIGLRVFWLMLSAIVVLVIARFFLRSI
jgi:hypothetical protein